MDVTFYRGMIRTLLYLTANRLDIMLSVRLYTRYQADPKESHHLVVKHIMWYLVGTSHQGLWYPSSTTCSLLGYSNADIASSRTDRKNIMGGCQFIGYYFVSWQYKK